MEKIKIRKGKGNQSTSFFVFKIVIFILFTIYAITLIYPVIWGFLASLKSHYELMNLNRNGLPKEWLFSNYIDAFVSISENQTSVLTMLWNSIWYTLGGTLLGVFVSSMTAYVAAKYVFPGRKIVYAVSVFVMMLPIVGAMPSQYRIYTALGIVNTPLIVLTFAAGVGFNFYRSVFFLPTLSREYAERHS